MFLNWISFITVIFWIALFLFLLNSSDLLTIILYSEIVWVILYSYTAVIGATNDDLIMITTSFFLLALAGLEFCLGFIITIFFRNFKKTFNTQIDIKNNNSEKNKGANLNRYIWNFTK